MLRLLVLASVSAYLVGADVGLRLAAARTTKPRSPDDVVALVGSERLLERDLVRFNAYREALYGASSRSARIAELTLRQQWLALARAEGVSVSEPLLASEIIRRGTMIAATHASEREQNPPAHGIRRRATQPRPAQPSVADPELDREARADAVAAHARAVLSARFGPADLDRRFPIQKSKENG